MNPTSRPTSRLVDGVKIHAHGDLTGNPYVVTPRDLSPEEAASSRQEGLGSAVSSPSGVWGRAPVEIEFGAFLPKNLTSGDNNFNDFLENQLIKFGAV